MDETPNPPPAGPDDYGAQPPESLATFDVPVGPYNGISACAKPTSAGEGRPDDDPGTGGGLIKCDDARSALAEAHALDEVKERMLVHCHAGCSQESVFAALKDRKLWPEPPKAEVTGSNPVVSAKSFNSLSRATSGRDDRLCALSARYGVDPSFSEGAP